MATHWRRLRRRLLLLVTLALIYQLTRPQHDDTALHTAIRAVRYSPSPSRNLVILTAVNFAFRQYLFNMVCSMRAHLPATLLVLSLDRAMHDFASARGYNSVLLDGSDVDTDEHVFGSRGFNLLSKRKLHAVYAVLKTGVDVLFVDADIVWCGNAAKEIVDAVYSQNDPPHMLMQTAWPRSLLNSGLYYARATRETGELFEAFLSHDGDTENDQVIVNRVLCHGTSGEFDMNGSYAHPSAPHRHMPAGCTWDGRVRARLLDASRFPTGGEVVDGKKIFHHPRSYIVDACGRSQFALLHNNCILSQKKKARFVVKGLWYVDGDSCGEPARATKAARRACGGSKCGIEGDLHRFPDLVV